MTLKRSFVALAAALAMVWLTPEASAAISLDRQPAANNTRLGPQVKITSPVDGAFIAPGDSRIGDGDRNGTGFAIVAEIVTRDGKNVAVDEDVNIRHVDALPGLNPQFPGLLVFIDEDLITPNGGVIRRLAPMMW